MRVTGEVLPLLSAIKALHRDVDRMREELEAMRARTETMNERGLLLLPPSVITAAATVAVLPQVEAGSEDSEVSE